jgi:hypothetical protein
LNYSLVLEGEAQSSAFNNSPGVPPAGQYKGTFVHFSDDGDPESDALSKAINLASAAIADCKYKDYGVGFSRDDEHEIDIVSIVLGVPAAPPPPPLPPPPPPPPPPVARSHTPYTPPPGLPDQPPPAAVTNAITLSFSPPSLGSITATVANSSDMTGQCTYDAYGLAKTHRDFTVGPKNQASLTFKGVNTGTSYHVVVNCTDATGKQTQPIGHVEQDVTF